MVEKSAGNNHLCSLLTDIRSERQYSMRKMAKVCGVSREALRKYEKGLLIPSNQTLLQIFDKLDIDPKESDTARMVLISVYQARRERSNNGIRSFGPSAQLEIEALTDGNGGIEIKIDKLIDLFFEEVGPERKNDSFEFFLRQKIQKILRS